MSIEHDDTPELADRAVAIGMEIAKYLDPLIHALTVKLGPENMGSFLLGRAGMYLELAGYDVAANLRMMADMEEGKDVTIDGKTFKTAEVAAEVERAARRAGMDKMGDDE